MQDCSKDTLLYSRPSALSARNDYHVKYMIEEYLFSTPLMADCDLQHALNQSFSIEIITQTCRKADLLAYKVFFSTKSFMCSKQKIHAQPDNFHLTTCTLPQKMQLSLSQNCRLFVVKIYNDQN